jgi:SAM-dependent methyltransferase
MPSGTADLLWKLWYPMLTRLTRRAPVHFLNYGYASSDGEDGKPVLLAEDEANRPCIQLYDSVARGADLSGLRVLEISCGHGGGASYVARYFKLQSMHGVDRNTQAVALCQRQHKTPGLSFSRGDAMALEFADDTFDAVINVEASHCYSNMARFLREVARVLKPGGHFLYADFRLTNPNASLLHQQLEQSGMAVIERVDISSNVIAGMQANTDKYMAMIRRFVPGILRKPAMRFAGVAGSPIYQELRSGKTVYLRYVLRKSAAK